VKFTNVAVGHTTQPASHRLDTLVLSSEKKNVTYVKILVKWSESFVDCF
jgi:hypothetical protein